MKQSLLLQLSLVAPAISAALAAAAEDPALALPDFSLDIADHAPLDLDLHRHAASPDDRSTAGHKKGKHRKKKSKCRSTSIYDVIPAARFEPSDASWDPVSKTLYVVDDNGQLAGIPGSYLANDATTAAPRRAHAHAAGAQSPLFNSPSAAPAVKLWRVADDMDLEGCAVDHAFPELVYLGVESPATVLVFNTTAGAVQARFDIERYLSEDPRGHGHGSGAQAMGNAGLEALAFYTAPGTQTPRLLAGRQSDAAVFAFEFSSDDRRRLAYRGAVQAPGPRRDLAAMTVFLGRVYFVYDKDYRAVSVPLAQVEDTLMRGRRQPYEGWQKEEFDFDVRGHEGLAFAYDSFECAYGVDGCLDGDQEAIDQTPVVCAIDPPGRKGKDVTVNTVWQMKKCWQR